MLICLRKMDLAVSADYHRLCRRRVTIIPRFLVVVKCFLGTPIRPALINFARAVGWVLVRQSAVAVGMLMPESRTPLEGGREGGVFNTPTAGHHKKGDRRNDPESPTATTARYRRASWAKHHHFVPRVIFFCAVDVPSRWQPKKITKAGNRHGRDTPPNSRPCLLYKMQILYNRE